jgi:GDP-mannose 6-dehydrogenase
LTCVNDAGDNLDSCDIAIVCVGTPSGSNGAHNMSFIAEVSRQIATSIKPDRPSPLAVIYRSTIRPGTIEGMIYPIFETILGPNVTCVELVYNPEFLRESVAIEDYFKPPKIVIGTKDRQPSKLVKELNKNITAPTFYTGYREAEITKFVDNTFHALKVSFANEIGRICVNLQIDAKTVHQIFVSDTKLNISPYYMRPGGAFGGSCLPKDVRALQFMGAQTGAGLHLIDSLIRSNDAHKHFLFQHCTRELKGPSKILMLGLAFKHDSDDLRESPNVELARDILWDGHNLSVYDPSLIPKKLMGQNLGYAYTNLPQLRDLLVDKSAVIPGNFDLIIDTNGSAKRLGLSSDNIVDIDTL